LTLLLATPVYALEAPEFDWSAVVVEEVEETIEEEIVEEKWVDKDTSILCNCWAYVTQRIGKVMPMANFVPNSEPLVGGVAIEYFGNLKHVSYIIEVTELGVTVQETNHTHCQYGERFIPFNSPRLRGFWHTP
jgi:hypothetical protein